MNGRNLPWKVTTIITLAAVLAACSNSSAPASAPGAAAVSNAETKASTAAASSGTQESAAAAPVGEVTFDQDDLGTDWQNKNPNYIELTGSSANMKGTGAAISGSQIMIMQAGVYVISGKLDNGQIIVDSENDGTVRLVLNGVDIHRNDNAAIYVKKADKTVITLAEGTQNTLSDGAKYANQDAEDEPNATIYSKDDLTINGLGSLTVQGNFKDGLTGRDELRIAGGQLTIKAVDDALIGRDLVAVKDVTLRIDAGGDGMKASNDQDSGKGHIALDGGSYTIKAAKDAIQAEASVRVAGGTYTLTTGGGSASAPAKVNNDRPGSQAASSSASDDSDSMKGIKAGSDLTITGGTLKLDTADDALHSNNSLNITDGDIQIASGDKGVHADSALTISGGKTTVIKSFEGLESKLVTISGGETRVTTSDDGVNVTAGNEGKGSELHVTGGYLAVNSISDGLDANGSIYMTGGTVVVSGPQVANMGTGALDYDGVLEVTGGTLISASGMGKAQSPSASTKQYSISMNFPAVQQAGTIVSLKDSSNKTIATFAPVKPFQTVVISSPELKKGGTYTLYTGGTSTGTATDGFYNGGDNQGGTKVVGFTVTDVITWLNESGVTTAPSNRGGGGAGAPRR